MIVSLAMLERVLQSEDMEGLHALGAPENEYHDEATAIKTALERLDSSQVTRPRVSAVVMDVWARSFGPFSSEDVQKRRLVLQEIVHRILNEGYACVSDKEPETSAGAGDFAMGA